MGMREYCGGYWGVIGVPGCTMDNVIEGDGNVNISAFSIH